MTSAYKEEMRVRAAILVGLVSGCSSASLAVELPEPGATVVLVRERDGILDVRAYSADGRGGTPGPAHPEDERVTAIVYYATPEALGIAPGELKIDPAGRPLPVLDRARAYRLDRGGDGEPLWRAVSDLEASVTAARFDIDLDGVGCVALDYESVDFRVNGAARKVNAIAALEVGDRVWVAFQEENTLAVSRDGRVEVVHEPDGADLRVDAMWRAPSGAVWMIRSTGGTRVLTQVTIDATDPTRLARIDAEHTIPSPAPYYLWLAGREPAPGTVDLHLVSPRGIWQRFDGATVNLLADWQGDRRSLDNRGGVAVRDDGVAIVAMNDSSGVRTYGRDGMVRLGPALSDAPMVGAALVHGELLAASNQGMVYGYDGARWRQVTAESGGANLGDTFLPIDDGFFLMGGNGAIRQWRPRGWCPTLLPVARQTLKVAVWLDDTTFIVTGTSPDAAANDPNFATPFHYVTVRR